MIPTYGAPWCGIYASLQQAEFAPEYTELNTPNLNMTHLVFSHNKAISLQYQYYLCNICGLKQFPTMGRAGESRKGGLI